MMMNAFIFQSKRCTKIVVPYEQEVEKIQKQVPRLIEVMSVVFIILQRV